MKALCIIRLQPLFFSLPTELLGPTGSVQSNDILGAKAQPVPLGIAMHSAILIADL
jgi:hypothetical protein